MIQVNVKMSGFDKLSDPSLMAKAESEIVERGVEILEPLARAAAPSRTGKSKSYIIGSVEAKGGRAVGRVYIGQKGFPLRILHTGSRAHTTRAKQDRVLTSRRVLSRKPRPNALKFTFGGTLFYRANVQIPALSPRPFLEEAANIGEPAVGREAESILTRVLA